MTMDVAATIDPELAAALAQLPMGSIDFGTFTLENIPTMREAMANMPVVELPPTTTVSREVVVPGATGFDPTVRVYSPPTEASGRPCIYWIHGGGYLFGSGLNVDARINRWSGPAAWTAETIEDPQAGPNTEVHLDAGGNLMVGHALAVDAEFPRVVLKPRPGSNTIPAPTYAEVVHTVLVNQRRHELFRLTGVELGARFGIDPKYLCDMRQACAVADQAAAGRQVTVDSTTVVEVVRLLQMPDPYGHGLSAQETADRLNLTEVAVRVAGSKACRRLSADDAVRYVEAVYALVMPEVHEPRHRVTKRRYYPRLEVSPFPAVRR